MKCTISGLNCRAVRRVPAGFVSTALVLALTGCTALDYGPAGIAAWIAADDDELRADTQPTLEGELYSASRGQVRIQAAQNETIGLQLALRTARPPAGPFDIKVSDFKSADSALLSADVVSLFRVHSVPIEQYRSWFPAHVQRTALPANYPDILVPWTAPRGGGPVQIGNSGNELIWIDVRVPSATPPGTYTARLEVRRADEQSPTFATEIVLEVLPIALPALRSIPFICRVEPNDLLAAELKWAPQDPEEIRLRPEATEQARAIKLINATMSLLHSHRLNPVLWAAFPKITPIEERQVEMEWEPYDALVSGWLDGTAFPDGVALAAWPLPLSHDYPRGDRNGGLGSPRYARLLAACLAECERHFTERGWRERAFLRMLPPAPLDGDRVGQLRRISSIVRQSETRFPIAAFLPPRSLRGLGWYNAPAIDLPDVSVWSPVANWYEPDAMQSETNLERRNWLLCGDPPYAPSLNVESLASDARALPWLAYRYLLDAVWIENAADQAHRSARPDGSTPWITHPLVYSGVEFGLNEQPVPSIRLKRLLRGLQDYELLRLLEGSGKQLLAQTLARQIVDRALTDACHGDLLSAADGGWASDPQVYRLARTLILQELSAGAQAESAPTSAPIGALSQWSLMMNQAQRIQTQIDGARIETIDGALKAAVRVHAVNGTSRPLEGEWRLTSPATTEWQQDGETRMTLPGGSRRSAAIHLTLAGVTYNAEGIYPFELTFDTPERGTFATPGRLSVATCPLVQKPPRIDGDLTDWAIASNNIAGGFQLVRGPAGAAPRLGTQAFFCMDRTTLYIAIRCILAPGERPEARADNSVSIDGAIPWWQDVIEVLIDPRSASGSTRPDDLFVLQIKPNGLVVARRGYRTEPPMMLSDEWRSRAAVSAEVTAESWVTEISIPLDSFGEDATRNRMWGLNLTRLDARRGEYSSWSGARDVTYWPHTLGNLVLLLP